MLLTKGLKIVEEFPLEQYDYLQFDDLLSSYDMLMFDQKVNEKILVFNGQRDIEREYLKYFLKHSAPFKANKIYLNVTRSCNSNCIYCFSHNNNGNKRMDFSELVRNIDDIIKYSGTDGILISFFGGEPLLNYQFIKETVDNLKSHLSSKLIKFDITTNGILLNDERMSFISENFSQVTISVDGDDIAMQKNRVCSLSETKKLFDNIKKFVKIFPFLSLRATITKNNMDIANIYKFFRELGVKAIRFQPATCSPGADYAITDWQYFCEQIERVTDLYYQDWLMDKSITLSPFSYMLKQMISRKEKFINCSLHKLCFDEQFNLYPCYRFFGEDNSDLMFEGDIEKCDLFFKLVLAFVDNKPLCKECWAKYLCGGGCYVDNYYATGSFSGTDVQHCIFTKAIIKSSIVLYKRMYGGKL